MSHEKIQFRGDLLRERREAAGLSPVALGIKLHECGASATAVTRASVYAWENGTTFPSSPMLAALCEILGMTAMEFFSDPRGGAKP